MKKSQNQNQTENVLIKKRIQPSLTGGQSATAGKVMMPPFEVYIRQMPANRIRNEELFVNYTPLLDSDFREST
jgi:hypothetical protein